MHGGNGINCSIQIHIKEHNTWAEEHRVGKPDTLNTMEPDKKPSVEKKTDEKEKPVGEKKTQSSSSTCIVVVIILLVLLVLAGVAGFFVVRVFGKSIVQNLPVTITRMIPGLNLLPTTEIVYPTPQLIHSPASSEEPSPPPDEETSAEYILSYSNTQKLVTSNLEGLTPWELKVARNEIYARHGRPFVHKDLSCYFAKQSWYTVDPAYTEKSLSSLEVSNAVFILNYENETGSPLVNKDSGCK
jgi:flagellar basal body-associated protein FliL